VANQHSAAYVTGRLVALKICKSPWGPLLQQQSSFAVKNQAVHSTVAQAFGMYH